MKKDIAIAIVGASILIAGLIFISIRRNSDNLLYLVCDSFPNQPEAQRYFEDHGATHLDGDKDGVACEELQIKSTPRPLFPIKLTSTPTPSPATLKVEGEAKVIVEQPTNEPTQEPTLTPTISPTATPQPTPTPNPTPTPLVCVLGVCL